MAIQHAALSIRYRPVSALKPNPANPRKHQPRQINLLAKSIQALGFNVPILIDGDDQVIAGHGRLLACQKLGYQEVPTIRLEHLTAEQVQAFTLADNKLCELSSWDDQLLGEQLKALSLVNLDFDIEATGFTVGEIDLCIEALDQAPRPDTLDEFSLHHGAVVTQLGDLWQLDQHRVLCGNALDAQAYQQLLDGRLAAVVFSDSPFNVRINGHVSGKGGIHAEFAMASGEMSTAEFTQFLTDVFRHLAAHSEPGAIHFQCIDWRHLPEILAAGQSAYHALKNLCVWVKSQAGMGSFFRSQHELILVYQANPGKHRNNIELGRFGRYRTNVWQYPSILAMRHGEEGDLLKLHPTVKPTRMVADAILDCSKRKDIILDPFLGSGTTLLAAQRTERVCHAIELEPRYVDTAILRWQNLTGQDAVHLPSGQTYTERQQKAEVHHD